VFILNKIPYVANKKPRRIKRNRKGQKSQHYMANFAAASFIFACNNKMYTLMIFVYLGKWQQRCGLLLSLLQQLFVFIVRQHSTAMQSRILLKQCFTSRIHVCPSVCPVPRTTMQHYRPSALLLTYDLFPIAYQKQIVHIAEVFVDRAYF